LAHALELPGKLRLGEAEYRVVQSVYYPGFTIGGFIGELGGILVLTGALVLLPKETVRFYWTVGSLVLLCAVHAVYWLMTHPVNNVWVSTVPMPKAASTFFATFGGGGRDWRQLRRQWECSHIVRACLSMASLTMLAISQAIGNEHQVSAGATGAMALLIGVKSGLPVRRAAQHRERVLASTRVGRPFVGRDGSPMRHKA
jgi:hypothetical protein